MIGDIVIAVAAAVCQLLTAVLGWRVTMTPLDPNDPKQRKKRTLYNALFLLAGLVGVALVGFGAYRLPREHAHFAFETAAAYVGPSGQTSWASGTGDRRAEFLVVDKQIAFNIWLTNVGPGTASDLRFYKSVFPEPDGSPRNENDAIGQFEKLKTADSPTKVGTLAKGEKVYTTAFGPVLSPEDYNNLVYDRRVLFVLVEASYRDDSGEHVRQICESLLPPQSGGMLIWARCAKFNDEM